MRAYYEEERVAIYLGDCAEVMATLDLPADTVTITDPPYGVDLGGTAGAGDGHGLALAAYDSLADTYDHFVASIVPRINASLDRSVRGAVFTGPHIHEQRKPDAIGGVFCPASNARHRWGFKSFLPVLLYGTAPGLASGSKATAIRSTETADRSDNDHPVPKPLGWLRWLVALASAPTDTVIDPFMGSGTTLVAARSHGRRSIGIDVSERYCEIAVRRLRQRELF